MEESTVLQSMLNILNSNYPPKKSIIEALPILLDSYDVHKEFKIYNLIVISAQNVCIKIINSQFDNFEWKDSDVSLDNLKSLLLYFINLIQKHSITDIVQLFQQCAELSNKVDFKSCSNEKIRNIGFCMQKLYILCRNEVENSLHLDNLRNALRNVLNESYLIKNKLDAVLTFLNNIVSIYYIPKLWQYVKPVIRNYPDRIINLLFNMQDLFFDSSCVDVILNDDDFWSLLCNLLTCENNVIRTYNNVVLKLSCFQISNLCVNYFSNENREQYIKIWNDYVIVIETLENTQQHLTLPIINTAKNLASNKTNDYKLPLKWITAMYCKMSKHSSKHIVMASIDIITNMSITSLKADEQLLQLFANSLNNIFLYKMSSELCIKQPQLENILSAWFNKLMMSNDGYDVFGIFLSYIPSIKWSIVPITFLTKCLADISLSISSNFNIIHYALKIKSSVEKMPNTYLKTVVLSYIFIFTSKFLECVNAEFCCDLFDCITISHKNTKTWEFMIDSIHKINNLDNLNKQLSQYIHEKDKAYSTSIGLFVLSNISIKYQLPCIETLNDISSCTVDNLDLVFIECLLRIENNYGKYDTCISQILDNHIWSLTTRLIEKCLKIKDHSYDDLIIRSYLDKVLSSNRIVNTTNIMNDWLLQCEYNMKQYGNYSVLTIYNWIGKYSTTYSTERTLQNDWLSLTNSFIHSGFFSLDQNSYCNIKKSEMYTISQLDLINTFFQYSTVSEEHMLDILDWLSEKTVEHNDNYWSIYFLTVKTFLRKFPIQVNLEKVIQLIENCWEFLISCRVSCYPNSTKHFIEMAFQYNLLIENNYAKFIKYQVINIF